MSAVAFLHGQDLVKIYRGRRVLDRVSVTASPGQRLGLVGENGVGKSTLLRLLAGVEEPDHGGVVRPADTGFLHQELPWPAHQTVGGVVDEALAEVRAALRRLDELAVALAHGSAQATSAQRLLAEYGEMLEWAQAAEAWDADRRATLVLAGLGLAGLDRHRRLGTLSGGQRSRLGLAALLVRRPRALLLDEPTNHLDDDAVQFLQDHLRGLPGVVVIASHDRVFLDELCTDICDLDPARHGLTRYRGGYSDYLRAKRAERRRWEQAWAAQQDQIGQLRVAVATTARRVAPNRPIRDNNKVAYDRHGERVLGSVASRVRNARLRLDKLVADQIPRPPAPLRFDGRMGTSAEPADGAPVLAVRGVCVPGRLRLAELDVPAGGRLLVTGPNGAGKSTLLNVLAGRLRPAAGRVRTPPGTTVGLLDQDAHFPVPRRTAREVYAAALGELAERTPLGELGLLGAAELDRAVGELSVGQRRRLALAILVASGPQVLLLDEPTNHISLALADELEQALHASPGTVVVATHDRWQRRHWDGARLRLVAGHPAGYEPAACA